MENILSSAVTDNYFQWYYALEEAYDLQMGIYVDYDNPAIKRPYAVLAYHPTEEKISGTLLDRWSKRYMEYNIFETTGLTFGEFLRMDMESVITIYINAKAMAIKKSQNLDDAEQQLKNLENKNKETK